MIGGLSFQVFSITIFAGLCVNYVLHIHRYGEKEPSYKAFRRSRRFKGSLVALAVAIVTIYIRSIFRVAELQHGFGSRLASNQVTFMILEGAMILIAAVALTAFHPTLVFGDLWQEVTRGIRKPATKSELAW